MKKILSCFGLSVVLGMVLLISTTVLVCSSVNSEEPAGREISIVLDPAFGGTETGAVGCWGLKEKDVTLDVAIRTKEYLEKDNPVMKVYLTRTKDEAVSEEEREKFIQAQNPVLVVRLRLNSSNNTDASGLSVRYDKGNKESKRLAEIISAEIADTVKKDIVPNEGIKPSDIYKNIQIPAVEVFLGYITNQNIEANFRIPKAKEAFAESIGRAIVQYLKDTEKKT
jgi:N-acetylmuramoyl-L-alanine amidase